MTIEKRTSASARFRAVRLLVDDLRKIGSELGQMGVTWQTGAYSSLGAWSWRTVYAKSSSLDELIKIAPKGRVYSFEISASSGDQRFSLEIPGPNRRFVSLKYEGPGDEPPDSYWNIAELLKGAEKRGQKRHYAGTSIGPAIALSVPLLILDKVARLGWFYDETRPVLADKIGLAVSGAIVSLFVLGAIAAGFYVWATSSGVTLRPIIDTESVLQRMVGGVANTARWIWTAHRDEDLNKQIMLLATVIAAVCGAGSLVVSLLK